MIIKTQELLLDNLDDKIMAWVDDSVVDTPDLAGIVDSVIAKNIRMISVPMASNGKIWPWVEHKNIHIFNRVDFASNDEGDNAVSVFAENVIRAFKTGADGVQVFVQCADIENFVRAINPIRDDLFFDHHFSVVLNVDERGGINWEYIFDAIKRVRANSVLVMAHGDSFDAKSDFVGRIYGMLENWNLNADLHLMFGKNMMRVTQVSRLVQKMRPDLMKNMRVFVSV